MSDRASDLAWRLADEIATTLTDQDKVTVYTELGAGELWHVITRLLSSALHSELALPADLIAELTAWLDKHIGSPEEPLVRNLLMGIQNRDCPST
ncbi:hypothetical protein [Mycolicibacter icosiumassiliensis]|uniref:hypothetical protein n=1 Tax=Mycolicibacter icosiumassiliensis TaxID=1792835 RepID=UPI000831672E|nr:hypothetical protein [Mycolicibacter icosiumassiliensis]